MVGFFEYGCLLFPSALQSSVSLPTFERTELTALMMEAVQTSETSVNSHHIARRYNPEDGHLHIHRRENLKSYLIFLFEFSFRIATIIVLSNNHFCEKII
jgi:hypothetical protein